MQATAGAGADVGTLRGGCQGPLKLSLLRTGGGSTNHRPFSPTSRSAEPSLVICDTYSLAFAHSALPSPSRQRYRRHPSGQPQRLLPGGSPPPYVPVTAAAYSCRASRLPPPTTSGRSAEPSPTRTRASPSLTTGTVARDRK